jgi:AbrB family looped-hinge helix DNA binding protein
METAIVKVSSKGQVVIPAVLRRAIGLATGDEMYAVGNEDTLILKKIQKKDLEREFEAAVKPIRAKMKKLGVSRKDVQSEIQAYRRVQRKNA